MVLPLPVTESQAAGAGQSSAFKRETPAPVVILVDAVANRHAINPNIYGLAYADASTLSDLDCIPEEIKPAKITVAAKKEGAT